MAEMTKEDFLALQREMEGLEMEIAKGYDSPKGTARFKELEAMMGQTPWTLHPDYGCIPKSEAVLIEALEDVSRQLRDHPDVSRGNSKVHYCYHKAEGALKDAANRRVALVTKKPKGASVEESYRNLEDDKIYVIDAQTKALVDGPFDRYGEVPLRLMGFDGSHVVKTGSELKASLPA